MLNTTIFALSALHLSMSPLFAGKQSLSIHRSQFSRFLSPIVFNSRITISHAAFTKGLSAAVYINQIRETSTPQKLEVFNNSDVVFEEVWFRDITQSDFGAVFINASQAVTANGIVFSGCKIANAATVLFVTARTVSITSMCMFNCSANDVAGFEIDSEKDLSKVTMVTVYKCEGGQEPVRATGSGNFLSFLNVSHCTDGKRACGVSLIRGADGDAASGLEYVLVQHGSAPCAIWTGAEDETATKLLTAIDLAQILNNQVTTFGLVRLAGDVMFSNGFFVGNTVKDGVYFTARKESDSAIVSKCFMDFPVVSVSGITFSSCSFDQKSIPLKTFYGLNTLACVAEPEPIDINNFFDQFSSEETISLIIVGIALFTAIIQIIVYGVIACKHRKKVEADSEYDYSSYSDSSEFETSSSSR